MVGLARAELSKGIVNSLLSVQAKITIALDTHLTFSEKLPSKACYVLGL